CVESFVSSRMVGARSGLKQLRPLLREGTMNGTMGANAPRSEVILSRESARALDRAAIEDYGIPGVVLMENAGRGVAELLRALGARGKVCICCGKGNNGGDGLVVARYLDIAQVPISIVLFGRPEDLSGEAALNYHIVSKARLPVACYSDETFAKEPLERELQ